MARTYQRTYRTLQRMIDEGIVDRGRDHIDDPHLYWLTETGLRWMTGELNRKHEVNCSKLCVAYAPHWKYWDDGWSSYERTELNVERWDVEYDRRMLLANRLFQESQRRPVFLWEVDGSSEPIYRDERREEISEKKWRKSVNYKLDKYLKFGRDNPEAWFHVLFATFSGKLATAAERANQLKEFFEDRGLTRGQFLVTTVDRACADPLGKVFLKPGAREFHSVLDV